MSNLFTPSHGTANCNQDHAEQATKSASLAHAKREVKALQKENETLKTELSEIKLLYSQLVKESSHEVFDERRVNLLKSQVIQLERQVLLLSEGLGTRSAILCEVEQGLVAVADICRLFISQQNIGPHVPVPRAELMKIVEIAESVKIKLSKSIENSTPDKLSKPVIMVSNFVKNSPSEPVTLMEICSGNIEHINLKHVGKLESKLTALYKQLLCLHQSLNMAVAEPSTESSFKPSSYQSSKIFDRLQSQVLKSSTMMEECCHQLLDLTVLVPNAPAPMLNKKLVKEMTVDNVMAVLPKFPRSKHKDGKQLIEGLIKACNYSGHMNTLKIKALEEELKHHKSVYQLQVDYTEGMFKAVRDSYVAFEENVHKLICDPIKVMLEAYDELQSSSSQEALRLFLSTFKDNSEQFKEITDSLSVHEGQESQGLEALSSFGQNFFETVKLKEKELNEKLDKLYIELQEETKAREEHISTKLQVLQKGNTGVEKSEKTNKMENSQMVSPTPLLCPEQGVHENDNKVYVGNHVADAVAFDNVLLSTPNNDQANSPCASPSGSQSHTPVLSPTQSPFGSSGALNGNSSLESIQQQVDQLSLETRDMIQKTTSSQKPPLSSVSKKKPVSSQLRSQSTMGMKRSSSLNAIGRSSVDSEGSRVPTPKARLGSTPGMAQSKLKLRKSISSSNESLSGKPVLGEIKTEATPKRKHSRIPSAQKTSFGFRSPRN